MGENFTFPPFFSEREKKSRVGEYEPHKNEKMEMKRLVFHSSSLFSSSISFSSLKRNDERGERRKPIGSSAVSIFSALGAHPVF